MIFKGSRYQGVNVYTVTTADGQTVSALGIRCIPTRRRASFIHSGSMSGSISSPINITGIQRNSG